MEFTAYISIFHTNFTPVDAICFTQPAYQGRGIYWQSNSTGYPDNSHCEYDLVIPPKGRIQMNVLLLYLETNVDTVTYEDLDGSLKSLKLYDTVIFDGFQNDTDRHIKFEFKADGSVRGREFQLQFFDYERK